MVDFIKKPCKHCPFRQDVKPFLNTEHAEDLAYSAENPYNSFPCHKTTESSEDGYDTQAAETSKECAGFLTLMHNTNGETPYDDEGFEPSALIYQSSEDMIEAYRIERYKP